MTRAGSSSSIRRRSKLLGWLEPPQSAAASVSSSTFRKCTRKSRVARQRLRLPRHSRKLRDRTELLAKRQDGSVFPVELAIAPFGVDGEKFFAAYLRDITVRKRLERELRQHADALGEASRRKDEFLAMLAHELRNPLAALSGAVAIAARSNDPDDLEWSRNAIQRNIRHLARLIDDLLDVSRVTQGKIELRKEHLEASCAIDQAVDSIQYLLAPEGPPDRGLARPRFALGPRRRHAAAADHRQPADERDPVLRGGKLHSRAARRANGEVVISVRDPGQGIRPELLPHVFELFKQGDRSLARTEGGLGIGLTMVKALTELHGGTVSAWSEGTGKGSEFVIRLPASACKDEQEMPESAQPMVAARPAQCKPDSRRRRQHRSLSP